MYVFISIFSFILGAIIGSFLDVVAMRWGTGKSLEGRSQCFSCGSTLTWRDLFPVLSYLFLRGHCRTCHARISPEHLWVEIVTGFVFLSLALQYGDQIVLALMLAVIYSILIVIGIYDMKHTIIPDTLAFAFGLLALGTLLLFGDISLWNILAGILIPLPFALLWLFSKGRLMGLGDAKLMVGIGWLLGMQLGIVAVIVAFWIGTAVSLSIMGVQILRAQRRFHPVSRKLIMKSEIPFAPFLIIGTFLVQIWGQSILAGILNLFSL